MAISVMLIDSMGISIVIPVMPELLLEVAPGLSNAEVASVGGLLTSLYALLQFLCGPLLGSLSDYYGRKPILTVSLTLMTCYYLCFGFANNLWLLVFGRVIGGISAATQSTANALIADISNKKEKAKRFGLLGAGFGVGFVLGPVLGGLLGEYGTRMPFFVAAVLCCSNALACWALLPETVHDAKRKPIEVNNLNPLGALSTFGAFKNMLPLLATYFLYTTSTAVYVTIWPYFTAEQFTWGPGEIGLSLTLYGLSFALIQSFLVQPFISRFGEAMTVVIGFIIEIISFFTISILYSGTLLLLLIPFSALGIVGQPALQALLSQATPNNQQGLLQGIIGSLTALSLILTPILITSIFYFFTKASAPVYFPGAPFFFSGCILVATLAYFLHIAPFSQEATAR